MPTTKKAKKVKTVPMLEKASVVFYKGFFSAGIHLLLVKDEEMWKPYKQSVLSGTRMPLRGGRSFETPEEAFNEASLMLVGEEVTNETVATG